MTSWHNFQEWRELAFRLKGGAGRALERNLEDESKAAYGRAIWLARAALRADEQDRPRDALGFLVEAGSEASQVSLYWWRWLDDRRRAA